MLVPFDAERVATACKLLRIGSEVRILSWCQMYAVSRCGLVLSSYVWKQQPDVPFRVLSRSPGSGGYVLVNIMVDRKRTPRRVHHLVAELFLPPPVSGQTEIRHLDGNPQNCHAENLAWGTHQENMQDMVRHGRCSFTRKK